MEAREIIEKSIHTVAPAAVIDLDLVHGRISGTVVAPEFESMNHLQRQRVIRDQIMADLGPHSDDLGMLLLYTPAEAEEVNLAEKAAQTEAQHQRARENKILRQN